MSTAIHRPHVGLPGRLHAEQLAPLTGVLTLVLGLGGLIVLEGPADRPELDQPGRVMLDYFAQHDTVVLGGFLMLLSVAVFIWFLGSLRDALRRIEGGTGRLSNVAYGGGLATAALMTAMPGASVLGAVYASELDAARAKTLFIIGDLFLYPAAITGAVLVGATALVVLRSGRLPHWLGWLSVPLALWLLVPPFSGTFENPAGWTALAALTVIPVWTALTALVLLLRRQRD
jgi:hypothetical protein